MQEDVAPVPTANTCLPLVLSNPFEGLLILCQFAAFCNPVCNTRLEAPSNIPPLRPLETTTLMLRIEKSSLHLCDKALFLIFRQNALLSGRHLDAAYILGEDTPYLQDKVVSAGEKFSCQHIIAPLQDYGLRAEYVDVSEIADSA